MWRDCFFFIFIPFILGGLAYYFVWNAGPAKPPGVVPLTLTWASPGPEQMDLRLLYTDVENLKLRVAELECQLAEGKQTAPPYLFHAPQKKGNQVSAAN